MMLAAGYAVADIAALKAINPASRANRQAKLVESADKGQPHWYIYKAASTATPNDDSVVISNDNPLLGRWHKIATTGDAANIVTEDQFLYVNASNGNDINDGLSIANAFATIQKAVNYAVSLNLNNFTITIQLADGTYNENVFLSAFGRGGKIIIEGNAANPEQVIINSLGGCFVFAYDKLSSPCYYVIQNMRLNNDDLGASISVPNGGRIDISNLIFGSTLTSHMAVEQNAILTILTDYVIRSGASNHLFVYNGGKVFCTGINITLAEEYDFSNSFFYCDFGAIIFAGGLTFLGTATGKRYTVATNGIIDTGGAGPTYLPGSIDGTVESQGQYL